MARSNGGTEIGNSLMDFQAMKSLEGLRFGGDPVNGGLAEMMKEFNELMGYWPEWEAEEAAIIEERFYFQVIRNFFGEEAFTKSFPRMTNTLKEQFLK